MATGKKDADLHVRLPQDLVAAAKRKARQIDRPLSQVIREMLRTWLAEQTLPTQAIK